ncbi:MAG: FtsW/RodA/SpoVE family cell cycle protein, partial [Gemmatimonadota bacterium]|nr:FtsW/RodA/SpoVE family cell cycle protein [Gemmatimonadota bacterium]
MARDETHLWESRLLGILAGTLGVFGVAVVYSASSIWAVQDGYAGSHFARQQLLGVIVGVIVLMIVARVDYHRWRPLAWPLLGATALLLVVLILPFTHAVAPEVNGARRWFSVFGWRIQPSEAAKFVVVLWTAMLAARKGDKLRGFRGGILPFLIILVPLSALVVIEPDLSTGAVLLVIAGTVLFAAGARIGHFLLLGLVAVPIAWHQIVSVQYRLARLVGFLSAGSDAAEANWQINQSLIGMGAGRAVGVGFGEGLQK